MKSSLFKKVLLVSLSCIMAVMLASCGKSGSKDEYVAVTEPTYPPFESTNDDGKLVGFDIDLINAIAKDQGFKYEIQALGFDASLQAVLPCW